MVNTTQSRSPYNLPPTDTKIDNLTYNPNADARPDNDEFNDATDPDMHPVGARGADNQPTGRNYLQEDRETEASEYSGSIPKSEVDDLLSNATSEERNVSGYTRGKKVDAFQQERDLDDALGQAGVLSDDKDVEISAASGRQ